METLVIKQYLANNIVIIDSVSEGNCLETVLNGN